METQNMLRDLTGRGGMKTFLLVLVSLAFVGCAQFQHKPPEALPFMERAQTKTEGQVRVTVAVPSAEESEQIFGFPLARNNMQPVWLEVENNSSIAFFLYHIAMDPDIYSSGEVAWKFQSSLYSKGAQQNIYNLFRDNEIDWFFKPGSTSSGFVYTNLKMGTKAVLVRLFAEKNVREFAFFVEVPGLKADHHELDPYTLYSEKDFIDLDDDGLRQALEDLPCCMTNKDGSGKSDPLNIVVIGPEEEIWAAFINRGWDEAEIIYGASLGRTIASSLFGRRYRYSPMSALYFYGRPQDVGLQKARQTVEERNHLRLWLSPMRYEGMPVYVGQISRDIGVKLTTKSPTLTTHEVDPDVDEARDYLMQDLLESQKVAKFGFVEGVGKAEMKNPRYNLTDSPYWTDGWRVVFVFSEEVVALDEVEVFDWKRLYQKYE
ncbi:MAG: LssY C-terminal domain-containing protein [Desulfobacterales bacterium]